MKNLKKYLETSHDLICFVDERRIISYVSPSYEKHFGIKSSEIVGKDLLNISPNGLRIKVFNTKKPVENVIHHKGNINIISTVEPIFIDGIFKGVISISKTVNELKDLVKKLEDIRRRIKIL